MKKLYFIGFGLIGASIAKSLKVRKPGMYDITVFDYHKEVSPVYQRAVEEKNVDRVSREFVELFDADIVLLCAPTLTNIKYLKEIKELSEELGKELPLLTDVGSVKGNIAKVAEELNISHRFLGGHPMAGSEKTGYDSANDHLLENAYYILTPNAQTHESDLALLKEMVDNTGALSIILDPEKHDRITAAISHVPHLIAAELVNLVQDSGDDTAMMRLLAAGGFKDITRIASSSPAMWQSICSSNQDAINNALDRYIAALQRIKLAVSEDDADYVYNAFDRAGAFRSSIPNSRGALPKTHFFYVDIEDKVGAIATVAATLVKHDISIKNIGIIHNREYEQGVLKVEFYDDLALDKAATQLASESYTVYRIEG